MNILEFIGLLSLFISGVALILLALGAIKIDIEWEDE